MKSLIIGSNGQVGTELAETLAARDGCDNVITSDIDSPNAKNHPYQHEILDVANSDQLSYVIRKHNITEIYNLGGLLSTVAEKSPIHALRVNLSGLVNVLEISVAVGVAKVFWPSSIAVFGPTTPKDKTRQRTIMEPTTVYGILKTAGEGFCEWYHDNKGLDTRILRFPGLISYKAPPGGGATDWAIGMLHQAAKGQEYQCPVEKDQELPMMYMQDAIRAMVELMEAPSESIRDRRGYNLSGFSASPNDFRMEIERQGSHAKIKYEVNGENEIAENWPNSIDDKAARDDWGWQPQCDLTSTTKDMLQNLAKALDEH